MENKERLDKMVPIRLIGMAWVPLFLTSFLSNNWLGIGLKALSLLWVFIPIKSALSPMWDRYGFLGAFVAVDTLLFAILIFANGPSWLNFLLGTLIVIGFGTMFWHIDKVNQG